MSERRLISRRRFTALVAGITAGSAAWGSPYGLDAGTFRVVCPFGPGGISDALSRVAAAEAQALTGQPWIVENVPGAGGAIGAARVARSEPDGRTILHPAAGTYRTLGGRAGRERNFDPLRDLRAVAVFGAMPVVCIARPDVPATTLRGLVDRLASSGAPLVYGTAGHGSTSHICGALVAQQAGLQDLHVPYKSSAAVVAAVLAGEVPLGLVDPMLVAPRLAMGELQCLGISSAARNEYLPGVETLAGQGLGRIDVVSWMGFCVPVATPDRVVDALSRLMRDIQAAQSMRTTLRTGFVSGTPMFGDQAQRFVVEDTRTFQRWMADLRISIS